MHDLFPGTGQASVDDGRPARSVPLRPLSIDPYVASSLLQKAIRRGDADLAERAAVTLHRRRGARIWRRFLVIAFEDIGVASSDALIKTNAACTAPGWRAEVEGGDARVLRLLARLLADAPKDRSPDHLISVAHRHPDFEDARRRVGAMSIARRVDHVADASVALPERAIAAWYASGIETGDERRVGRGDIDGLMRAFRQLGVPDDLLTATRIAATRSRETIVIMTPLLWLAATAGGNTGLVQCRVPPATMIGEIPAYTFDKHTLAGKAAIHRFARENLPVRNTLAAIVPEYRAKDAACMAAFHVDAAPVSRRFVWNGSDELERLGVEADMTKVHVPFDGIAPLLNVVRDNLDHLNAIRAELFRRSRVPVR